MIQKFLLGLCLIGFSLSSGLLMAQPDAGAYTSTKGMPVGNTAGPPEPGKNPNPESPAIYPQNQDYIQTQTPSDDKSRGAGVIEVNP